MERANIPEYSGGRLQEEVLKRKVGKKEKKKKKNKDGEK